MVDTSTSGSVESIWDEAFKTYKDQTNRDLKNDAVLRKLTTVDDVLTQIELSHTAFGSWRSKHEKVWNKLSACMGPIQVVGNISQKALELAPFGNEASAVLGAVLYLVKACDEVSTSYNLIESLFDELAEFTARLEEYAKGSLTQSMRKKMVATLTCILEIIGRSEELIKAKRFRHYIGVAWFGKDEKTKAALDRFHALIDSEERLVIAVTYSTVQKTEQGVQHLEMAIDDSQKVQKEIDGKVDQLTAAIKESKEEELLQKALSGPAVSKNRELFADFKDNLLEGTGEWLHDETLFRAWENEEASLLWVFGGPGAGKSFLSTKTILLLRDQHDQDPEHPSRVAVSFFFVKEDNQNLHDLNVILKTIAYQIVQKDEIYRKHVVTVCKSPEATNTAERTWQTLFLNFYTSVQGAESSAFIVIDGLDEAPLDTRRKFLGLLRALVNQAPGVRTPRPRLQIAVFGRPDLRDDMEFSRQEKFVNVSAEKNRKDINDYILSRLPMVRVLKAMKPSARNKFAKEIRTTILQRADGMFFWAKLVLDQIYRKERKSEVQQALQNAPKELDRMIRHIFERVASDPDVNIADLNKILSWVTCAKRPLLLGELHVILKLPTGEPNLSLRFRLRGKFASFFNMSKLEGENDEEEDSEEDEEDLALQEPAEEDDVLDFTNLSEDDEDDDEQEQDLGEENEDEEDETNSQKDEFKLDEKTKLDFETIEISFSHKRIKDYLVQEGGPDAVFLPPEYPKMPIGIDVNESEFELALTCLAILLDDITADEGQLNLLLYSAENFMKHIAAVDRSKISDENKLKLLNYLTILLHDERGINKLLQATVGSDEWYEDRRRNVFYHTWLATNEFSKAIREFFAEVESLDHAKFTAEQIEWMRLSVSSAKEFYKPLAMISSKIWLTKQGYDDAAYLDKSQLYVWVLHGYFALNDDGTRDDDVEDFELYRAPLSDISVENMRTYAEYAGLEKTTHWHAGLGWIMMDGEYYEAAIEEFQKALDLDSKAWVAQEGISRCYDGLKKVDLALEWMAKATETVPANLSFLVQGYFLPRVAPWLSSIGDHDRAIKAWKDVWEYDMWNLDHLTSYIWALNAGERHQDIIDLILEINGYESKARDFVDSLLVNLLVFNYDVFKPVGIACNAVNACAARDTFLAACDRAIAAADIYSSETEEQIPSYYIRSNVATFMHEYCDKTTEAITLWQKTIDLLNDFTAKTGQTFISARKECTNAICQLEFDYAVDAKDNGEDPSKWVESLQDRARFSTGLIGEDEESWIYGTGYASMIYGVWLRDYSGAEEEAWRKCFRAAIIQGIDLLNDEDPNNDQVAYVALAGALLMVNDVKNATAALNIALRPLEENAKKRALDEEAAMKKEQEALDNPEVAAAMAGDQTDVAASQVVISEAENTKDSEWIDEGAAQETKETVQLSSDGGELIKASNGDDTESILSSSSDSSIHPLLSSFELLTFCNGPCKTDSGDYRELHQCCICSDVVFCEACFPLFKAGKMPFRICNAKHRYFQVFPLPEGSGDVAASIVDGRVEGREEWLGALRREWAGKETGERVEGEGEEVGSAEEVEAGGEE